MRHVHTAIQAEFDSFFQNDIHDATTAGRIIFGRRVTEYFDLLYTVGGQAFEQDARSVALSFTSRPFKNMVAGVLLFRYTLPS
ncbi:MAG: hypothetical protein U0T56_09045 [Ferruginibacter sp.]